jgi:Poly(hydroxyalcanoate) granule associated protein (phasin)
MSDEKGKVTDKASEIAKNIWLAGVGAYGKAAGEAQERLEKAGVETPKLFKELVKAGAALEDEAKEKLAPKRGSSSSVEERINKVRENFSLNRPGRPDELSKLHDKVDLLSKKIDVLANALTEQGVIKAPKPARKPAARKAAPKKAPAKKATVKKTAKRKTTTSKKTTSRAGSKSK